MMIETAQVSTNPELTEKELTSWRQDLFDDVLPFVKSMSEIWIYPRTCVRPNRTTWWIQGKDFGHLLFSSLSSNNEPVEDLEHEMIVRGPKITFVKVARKIRSFLDCFYPELNTLPIRLISTSADEKEFFKTVKTFGAQEARRIIRTHLDSGQVIQPR